LRAFAAITSPDHRAFGIGIERRRASRAHMPRAHRVGEDHHQFAGHDTKLEILQHIRGDSLQNVPRQARRFQIDINTGLIQSRLSML